MKRMFSIALSVLMLFSYTGINCAWAIQAPQQKTLQAAPNARTIELAFVFDGPSDKNKSVLETFQKTITRSLLPDYKASFPDKWFSFRSAGFEGSSSFYPPATVSRPWLQPCRCRNTQ